MDNVIPDPGFAQGARAFGENAGGILSGLRDRVRRAAENCDDLPIELVYERKLREAAFDARDRGATISLCRGGLLVKKGCKAEIVRFDQVTADVLPRALNRVAPYVWEEAGFDRP